MCKTHTSRHSRITALVTNDNSRNLSLSYKYLCTYKYYTNSSFFYLPICGEDRLLVVSCSTKASCYSQDKNDHREEPPIIHKIICVHNGLHKGLYSHRQPHSAACCSHDFHNVAQKLFNIFLQSGNCKCFYAV